MIKMTEKDLNKAMHDSGFFKRLTPGEMMHVLITEIMLDGQVKDSDFEFWITQEEKWPEISLSERMDEILRVLEDPNPSRSLRALQKTGFMAFCMPYCLPIKKLMDKKTYYKIIDNFNLLETRTDDVAFKLALLMFSFDPYATEQLLRDANFEEDAVNWICNLIYFYMEFIRLHKQIKLQEFVARFGLDFYYDMNDYAQSIHKITKMHELKPQESKKFVDSMVKNGYVVDASELALTHDDLIAAGAESEDEVKALQTMLLRHLAKNPLDNKKEWELDYVKSLTQRQIDKEVKAVKRSLERRY